MPELLSALLDLLSPWHLFFLTLGTLLGLLVGILPGLGGTAGLALLLPFVFGMDPANALAMMIGLLAPTTTSDTFPSVLMGIPGTSGSQATVVDGFPLSKQGQAARALGAAFTASLFGGLFGALVLTGAIFYAQPIILAIGFGEQMMLVLLALSMIGMLTGTNAVKGLATCGIGLLIGSIGIAPGTGESRMTLGSIYLGDGIPIVIVGLGMFAIPEIVDLLRRHETIAKEGTLGAGWLQGLRDAFANKWLVLRCSGIGCLVGALPGLGGSVVDWIAYGHVIQTSRNRERFGSGDIRGVLAPESANNAKEGGALVPTLLFGIPGSGSMAILLGGLVLVGLEPGADMVEYHLDLTYMMIWSLALANVVGAGTCLVLAHPIARLTTVPYVLLAPFMLVLIFFAAFQASRDWGDLIALFVLGVIGIYLKRFGWPRPAVLIGFFLSPQLEASVYQTLQVYGLSFFERPIVLVLLVLTVVSVIAAVRLRPRRASLTEDGAHGASERWPQVAFTVLAIGFAVVVFADAIDRKFLAMLFPTVTAVVTLLLLLWVLASQWRQKAAHTVFYDEDRTGEVHSSVWHFLTWIAFILVGTALVGFPLAVAGFVFAFISAKAGGSFLRNAFLASLPIVFLGIMAHFLVLVYPKGLLQSLVAMPWWLGG